jgi:hypothetical protein
LSPIDAPKGITYQGAKGDGDNIDADDDENGDTTDGSMEDDKQAVYKNTTDKTGR